jgi:hypothetical protein
VLDVEAVARATKRPRDESTTAPVAVPAPAPEPEPEPVAPPPPTPLELLVTRTRDSLLASVPHYAPALSSVELVLRAVEPAAAAFVFEDSEYVKWPAAAVEALPNAMRAGCALTALAALSATVQPPWVKFDTQADAFYVYYPLWAHREGVLFQLATASVPVASTPAPAPKKSTCESDRAAMVKFAEWKCVQRNRFAILRALELVERGTPALRPVEDYTCTELDALESKDADTFRALEINVFGSMPGSRPVIQWFYVDAGRNVAGVRHSLFTHRDLVRSLLTAK